VRIILSKKKSGLFLAISIGLYLFAALTEKWLLSAKISLAGFVTVDPLINRKTLISSLVGNLGQTEINLVVIFCSLSCLILLLLLQLLETRARNHYFTITCSVWAAGILGNFLQRVQQGYTLDYLQIALPILEQYRFNVFDFLQLSGAALFCAQIAPELRRYYRAERRAIWPKLDNLGYALLKDLLFCIVVILIGNLAAIVSLFLVASQTLPQLGRISWFFILLVLFFQTLIFMVAWLKFSQICNSVNGVMIGIDRFVSSLEKKDPGDESSVLRDEPYNKHLYPLLSKIRKLRK
jgi:lipoprotein signal peptidase